jgi:lysozyme family protein
MTAFKTAYQLTMGHEGLYDNHPSDRGGETYCGIARNIHPHWEGWTVIDEVKSKLKKPTSTAQIAKALQKKKKDLSEMVEGFFKATFWDSLCLDELPDEAVTTELFEQSVNQGTATAARHLQYALNLLNRAGKDYADIAVDGRVGKRTIAAYHAFRQTASWPNRSHERNVRTLVKVFNALQFDRYRDFCEAHPEQETFIYGWINRV